MTNQSRRILPWAAGLTAAFILWLSVAFTTTMAQTGGQPWNIDKRALVSRADLIYSQPAERSEEGMPIGNGRMGSLVWTTPTSLRFQINRVDVFAANSATTSFPRSQTDYASGCGYLDIEFLDFGKEVFGGRNFNQHLSVYDGVMSLRGDGASLRIIAWPERDVIAVEVEDQREHPTPIVANLRMLRYIKQIIRGSQNLPANPHSNTILTGAQTATSTLSIRNSRIFLAQEFREGDFYSASAVAVGIMGRPSQADYMNESTVRLVAAAGKGRFILLIGSASSFDQKEDLADLAAKELDAAAGKGFEGLLAGAQAWWHDYWAKGFIRMHSEDGVADFVEQNYTYFLYVMGSSSRGSYPPRFGGMIWYTQGDLRAWGSQYWWANQSCYYNGLAPTNRPELLNPTFEMYYRMYDSCALAARQQWGSQGIWIPETTWFDGPAALSDPIASEMRELYLMRKPWDQHSAAFQRHAEGMASTNSRWNWISQDGSWELGRWVPKDKGFPPFGHTTHIFGTTAKIAYLYWQRYEYTLDQDWLRQRAYPMLKGAVEFYRNFPNLKKDADGKYHIYHTNSNEPAWGVKDSDEDMSALRGTLGPLIRASEILDVDADMRPIWKEFLENLAPIPTSTDPDALKPQEYAGPRVWVKGLRPAVKPGGLLPDPNTLPQWNFDLCTVHNEDMQWMEIANATYNAYFRQGIGPDTRAGTLSRLPIAGAALGRADAVRFLVPNQMRFSDGGTVERTGVFRNRLSQREGAGATECERLGRAAEALHTALLQSAPPAPGKDPILSVFPAWPKEWDATFTLLARGAFLVSASMEKGRIEFVRIESLAGGECRLRNPWSQTPVVLVRDRQPAQKLSGSLLRMNIPKGESVLLTQGKPANE
jgi:hypothetical protein